MAEKKKKLCVDQEKCIGCATCVALADKYFELNGEGKSTPKDPEAKMCAEIQEAIDSCPVEAISYK